MRRVVEVLYPIAIVGLGRIPETQLPEIIRQTTWNGITVWWRHPAYLIREGGREHREYPEYLEGFKELFKAVSLIKAGEDWRN